MRRLSPLLLLLLGSCASQPQYLQDPGSTLPFSKGVLVGQTFYTAGHLGLDPETNQAPEDPAREAALMLDALEETLGRAGMGMDNLVQVQLFCSDVELYDTFNAVYRERFSSHFPARAFIGSGELLRGCRFEIQGIAVR